MNINQVAAVLTRCAHADCSKCRYGILELRTKNEDIAQCQALLIEDMANECRRIVEMTEDDGK